MHTNRTPELVLGGLLTVALGGDDSVEVQLPAGLIQLFVDGAPQ